MNNWQLLVAGTAPGTVKADLVVATNRKLSFALAGPSQVTFDLPGDHPQAALMAELATDVFVTCNGEWMFKGRVGAANDNLTATNHTSSFTATDYRGMLDRRILWPTSTLGFTNLEQAEIAWRLLADSQLLSDLGIWRIPPAGGSDTLVPTGITRTMNYNPGQKVGEAIQLMAQQQNGFDWDVSGNGQFRLFYPARDRYRTGGSPTLAYGREVVAAQRQLASATFANAIYMTGAQGTLPVSVVAADTTTYGRFEAAIGKTDLKDQASVQLAAGLELMVDDALTATYSFTLAPGAFNPDLVWLGDSVHFFVAAGRLVIDLVKRITGIDVVLDDGGGETVTLTIGQTPSWVSAAAGGGGGSAGVTAIAAPPPPTIGAPSLPTGGGLITPGAFSLPNTLNNTSDRLGNLERGFSLPGAGGAGGNGFYLRAFTMSTGSGSGYIRWNPAQAIPASAGAQIDATQTIITLPNTNVIYGYRLNVRNLSTGGVTFTVGVWQNGDYFQDTVAHASVQVGPTNNVALFHGFFVADDPANTPTISVQVLASNGTFNLDAGIHIFELGQAPSSTTGGPGGPSTPAVGKPVGGLAAWYDATAIKGVPDGAIVATWPDLSANHYDLASVGTGPGPALRLTGASMIKNQPVVDFGTLDNHMASTPASIKLADPVTIFAVFKVTTTALTSWIAGYAYGSTPDGPDVQIFSGSYEARDDINAAFWASADTAAHVITGVLTRAAGANLVLRVDGVQRNITATSGPAYSPAQIFVGGISGGFRFMNGVIGEVLMYQGINLTVQQWQLNESYLKTKWGTP